MTGYLVSQFLGQVGVQSFQDRQMRLGLRYLADRQQRLAHVFVRFGQIRLQVKRPAIQPDGAFMLAHATYE